MPINIHVQAADVTDMMMNYFPSPTQNQDPDEKCTIGIEKKGRARKLQSTSKYSPN
jgi:hypothetical protein